MLDYGAQDFVDLENEALEDGGRVDLVLMSSVATFRSGPQADPSRRHAGVRRRSAAGAATYGLAIDAHLTCDDSELFTI
ncbi:hypothetical protein [Phytohabitans houttuyneae]|uniref:Uncharacterized protein n=1 Tax=Phytohabitans houttuyneae TaxID=1076126 RepID=A0A6V8KK04_9ACTN|nr:hypothetical protein [Phytohabitans houttuyneae]GFJ82077.1 hypothetical protein Phou_062570 [Phytohabitans houttuyneae]